MGIGSSSEQAQARLDQDVIYNAAPSKLDKRDPGQRFIELDEFPPEKIPGRFTGVLCRGNGWSVTTRFCSSPSTGVIWTLTWGESSLILSAGGGLSSSEQLGAARQRFLTSQTACFAVKEVATDTRYDVKVLPPLTVGTEGQTQIRAESQGFAVILPHCQVGAVMLRALLAESASSN